MRRREIAFQRGSASVELIAIMPFAALMLLIVFQLVAIFSQALEDIAEARAAAVSGLMRWSELHADQGFKRPCLGAMPQRSFHSTTNELPLGVGGFAVHIDAPQEVTVVGSPICLP